MHLKRLFYWIFISLIIIWVFLATIRTIYNFTKLFTEEYPWVKLSDQQKKEKLYGDIFPIYNMLEKNVGKNTNVYIVNNDGKSFFLLRYLLYPTKIFWISSEKEIPQIKTGNYVIFYHSIPFKNLETVKPVYVGPQNFIYKI